MPVPIPARCAWMATLALMSCAVSAEGPKVCSHVTLAITAINRIQLERRPSSASFKANNKQKATLHSVE